MIVWCMYNYYRQQGGRQNDRIFTYTNADIINNDTNNRLTEKVIW